MLPITNTENVVIIVNRYGYRYSVKPGSLVLHPEYATFKARIRGFDRHQDVTILREEIGTIVSDSGNE